MKQFEILFKQWSQLIPINFGFRWANVEVFLETSNEKIPYDAV